MVSLRILVYASFPTIRLTFVEPDNYFTSGKPNDPSFYICLSIVDFKKYSAVTFSTKGANINSNTFLVSVNHS